MTWEHDLCYGQVALLCKDFHNAERRFRAALANTYGHTDLANQVPKTLTLLAETLLCKGDSKSAMILANKSEAYFQTKNSGDAYTRGFNAYALGEIALQNGEQENAKRYFERAAELLPLILSPAHAYCRRASEFLKRGTECNKGEYGNDLPCPNEFAIDLQDEFPAKSQADYNAWFILSEKTSSALKEKPDEAYFCASELMKRAVRLFPFNHKSLGHTLSLVGRVLSINGLNGAEGFLLAAINLNSNACGENSEEVGRSQIDLAAHLGRQRLYKESAAAFATAFKLLRKIPGFRLASYEKDLEAYATNCLRQKCIEESKDLLDKAYIAMSCSVMDTAECCLQKAEDVLSQEFPKTDLEFFQLRIAYIDLYEELGDSAQLQQAKAAKKKIESSYNQQGRQQYLAERDLPPLATSYGRKAA